MHMPIKWGHEGPLSAIMPEHHITMPVIPAAVGVLSFIVGMLIGVMVGHKKCMVHEGMMGMKGAWGGGWSQKGKWGKGGKMHHHHGEGSPPCDCGMILIAEEDLGMGGSGGSMESSGSTRGQGSMSSSEGTGMGAGGGMSSGMEE
jgi:hypothetical protein